MTTAASNVLQIFQQQDVLKILTPLTNPSAKTPKPKRKVLLRKEAEYHLLELGQGPRFTFRGAYVA